MQARQKDIGLLILRVGIGLMFMIHGWPKMLGGPEKWLKIGKAMKYLGIEFAYPFWGFMASSAEFFGGLLLALGLAFRPAAGALFVTMVVAATMHLRSGDSLQQSSHAIEAAIVFLALILIGPGAYAAELRLRRGE